MYDRKGRKEKKKGRDFIEICRKGWKALMI